MELKSFRAKTMQQALELVRREFGTDASVLHTREVSRGLLSRIVLGRQVEVVASPAQEISAMASGGARVSERVPQSMDLQEEFNYRAKYRADLGDDSADQRGPLHSAVEQLCDDNHADAVGPLPHGRFEAYTDLIEADVDESTARELMDQLEVGESSELSTRDQLRELVASQVDTSGPIQLTPGMRRLVALVGPTGVGKTTTVAKLAANYRLREKQRVGLITVDTYRVAAVEQLRTYADIIDLPMEVVATPREMREAVARMTDLDLVLLDTAGRSPRDEVQIQELKSMLSEAQADEVHLVLSSTAAGKSLVHTAERFAEVGTTALLLTKLDEATSLGHLLGLVRSCQLPVSYLTNGQNVPDDIEVAASDSFAEAILSTAVSS